MRSPVWGWTDGEAQTRGDRCCTTRFSSRRGTTTEDGRKDSMVRGRGEESCTVYRDQMDPKLSRRWCSVAVVLSRKPKNMWLEFHKIETDVWICPSVWVCTYLLYFWCVFAVQLLILQQYQGRLLFTTVNMTAKWAKKTTLRVREREKNL